jgi:hypothetical protein
MLGECLSLALSLLLRYGDGIGQSCAECVRLLVMMMCLLPLCHAKNLIAADCVDYCHEHIWLSFSPAVRIIGV